MFRKNFRLPHKQTSLEVGKVRKVVISISRAVIPG